MNKFGLKLFFIIEILSCFLMISSAQFKESDFPPEKFKEFEKHFRPDFDVVDLDKDDLLSKNEIKALSPDITDIELQEFLSKSDVNNDTFISFKEFVLAGMDVYAAYYTEQESELDVIPDSEFPSKIYKTNDE